MKFKLIGYALDFVSFLLEKLEEDGKDIKQIILFGSVARGEAGKESDIDLFIEADEKIEGRLNKLRDEFYNSIKVKRYWSLLNVKNNINLSVGILKEWGDLERSMIANGVVLYGKYNKTPELKQNYLFILSLGKDRNKNLSLWRKLYGYTQKTKKKEYVAPGIIQEIGGKKLARAVFSISVERSQEMISFLRKNKVDFQIIPFWKDNGL